MARTGVAKFDYFRDRTLEVYLLPPTPWEDVLRLQQRFVYEVGESPRRRACLLICEHPSIVTVGRQGSRGHVRFDDEPNRPHVRWTNRGGGVWLQTPGQLAIYPILPLDPQQFGLERYRTALYETLQAVLADFDVRSERDEKSTGLIVGDRQIAAVGIAVKNWVSYHGCTLNVSLPPDRERWVQANPRLRDRKETCLLRERLLPIRPATVRSAVSNRFAETFGFGQVFTCPPPLILPAERHARAGVA